MALYNKEDAIDTMILFYLRKMIENIDDIYHHEFAWKSCSLQAAEVIYLHFVTILSVCWQNGDKIDDENDDVSNVDEDKDDDEDKNVSFSNKL